jgi:pyridoxal phosphate enzyme (YggS family)
VSKGQTSPAIETAFQAGIRHFGENYVSELLQKITLLAKFSIQWHFIGALQSNKVSTIASQIQWIHSLDREKIAVLLSAHRSSKLPPLNVCIQVNLDKEEHKNGICSEDLFDFASFVTTLPNLHLRGLMMIPKPCSQPDLQYQSFLRLTQLLHQCNQRLPLHLDTLSMGMSQDYKAAIQAGSTMLRIGQAIFGKRTP